MNRKVCLYLRVSTQDQSTELQKRELLDYIDSRGWRLAELFEDKISGTHTIRPQFQQALNLCRKRGADIFLVWKLDRAFRSLRDCISTISELSDLGVEFVSLRDQGMDLTTSSGRLMMHIVAAFAEFEASILRTRVRAGISNAKAKGIRLGRPPRLNFTLLAPDIPWTLFASRLCV